VSSNISDLNDLSDLLPGPVETNDDQHLYARKKEFKARPRVKRGSSGDVIEVVSIPSSESRFAINVPPAMVSLPSNQIQHYPARSNQGPFRQPPLADHGPEYIAQHQVNPWQPPQALPAQEIQQLNHIHNALAHMASANLIARTAASDVYKIQPQLPSTALWSPQQPQPLQRAFEYAPHDGPAQQHLGEVATHVASPHYEPRPTNSERGYFERRTENPYEVVVEPFLATRPQHAHNSVVNMVASPHPEDLQARRSPPSAKIEGATNSDWPDYDPTSEQQPIPAPQTQQQYQNNGKQSAERSRREDVLFWRTQAQLSHSRSASSLDDQSSTLASPEQSSPLTSVSGDGVGPSHRWTNEPEPRYNDRDEHPPGRFGQQLAAHNFLRPNQDKAPMLLRSKQSGYRPPTGRGVRFQDEPFEIPDTRPAPHTRNSHNPSMYTPEIYARPSAPDPPAPKADFSTYHPQRYQPRQYVEPEDNSLLERLSERLDNMELRQAESATRKAVEAAQKRRELERKEAYERGIEDAMAWKARSGGFGSFD
jgi:hypothetical protein